MFVWVFSNFEYMLGLCMHYTGLGRGSGVGMGVAKAGFLVLY